MQMYRDKVDIFLRCLSLMRLLAAKRRRAAIIVAVPLAVRRLTSIQSILNRKATMERKLAAKRRRAGTDKPSPVIQSAEQLKSLLSTLGAAAASSAAAPSK